jgi:hypothetical protein
MLTPPVLLLPSILLFLLLLLSLIGLILRFLFRLGQLNIIGHHLISEYDSLVRPPNPWGLGLHVDPTHVHVVQELLGETGGDVGFRDEREAEVQAGYYGLSQRQWALWEDRAQSVLVWERQELDRGLLGTGFGFWVRVYRTF